MNKSDIKPYSKSVSSLWCYNLQKPFKVVYVIVVWFKRTYNLLKPMTNSGWTQQPLEYPFLNCSKPNFWILIPLKQKSKKIWFFGGSLMGTRNMYFILQTEQKNPHCYNHEVTVRSLINNNASWIPSLMCHMLDICMGSGQKNKTTIQLQMIIGIYCDIYWCTLRREGGNSKQERYILLEKHPQLTPKHHLLTQTASLFCQEGCEKTHCGPIKGYLSRGTYSDLL